MTNGDDSTHPGPPAGRRATPRIVVVIPCLDDAPLLAACLHALAGQTRPADEVVVVDNGSRDDSVPVAERAGATVVHEPHRGIWPAVARGYDEAAARGDVIARLDADSVPPSTWVARLADAFAGEAPLDVLTGNARFYGGNRVVRWIGDHCYIGGMYVWLTPWFGHPPVFGSNFAMRAQTWRAVRPLVGRDDPDVHDDLDLGINLPRGTRVRYDPTLTMPVSARPFASWRAIGVRLRKVVTTFRRSWPAGAMWVKRGRSRPVRRSPSR